MNLIAPEKHDRLLTALGAGLSIRAAATYAAVNRGTSLRYAQMLPQRICRCGRAAHNGWCQARVALSASRQQFLTRIVAGGNIKPETLIRWAALKEEILAALVSAERICEVGESALSELRRFYSPNKTGTEFQGEDARLIAIADATQENDASSYSLFAALKKLHPAVQRFCRAVIDGATMSEAADECGVSREHLSAVLPPLRVFLRPYLTGEAA